MLIMMKSGVIRPITVCIVKNKDRLLASAGRDSVKKETFYRLIGGGIEFGETGEEALKREFQEELQTSLENVKYVTTLENIFTYEGQKGHEIVLVYEADLTNKDLYEKDEMKIMDTNEGGIAYWQKISDFKEKGLILYPENILRYI